MFITLLPYTLIFLLLYIVFDFLFLFAVSFFQKINYILTYLLTYLLTYSLRRPERCQRRLWGGLFNRSHRRSLRDLQISPFWHHVSETLRETSQRCIWDASLPAELGVLYRTVNFIMISYGLSSNMKIYYRYLPGVISYL